MRKNILYLLMGFIGAIFLDSCNYDNEEELFGTPEPIDEVSFITDILPIIQTRCALSGCHVTGAQSPDFTVTSNIFDRADRIKSRTSSGTMPPSNATGLTIEQITLIAQWVDDGAPNN